MRNGQSYLDIICVSEADRITTTVDSFIHCQMSSSSSTVGAARGDSLKLEGELSSSLTHP